MKYLLLVLLTIGCSNRAVMPVEAPSTGPQDCKEMKSIWTSISDSEVHDWRGLPFTFVYVPYSYVSSTGANCTQQMKWNMFTPEISGASFEFHLQGSPGSPCYDGDFYIRYQCTQVQICDSGFTSCKTFQ